MSLGKDIIQQQHTTAIPEAPLLPEKHGSSGKQQQLLSTTAESCCVLLCIQIGLRVPSTVPGFFSIREVQKVTIPYTARSHSQLVKVLFRQAADAGTEVIVSLAADGAEAGLGAASAGIGSVAGGSGGGALSRLTSRLSDPRIGGQLAIMDCCCLSRQRPVAFMVCSACSLQKQLDMGLGWAPRPLALLFGWL